MRNFLLYTPTDANINTSGAWLVFPTFMIAGLGSDIINGLAAASGTKSE